MIKERNCEIIMPFNDGIIILKTFTMHLARHHTIVTWFGRFALFIIYFWFGILKVVYISPANPLVDSLLQATMPFMSFNTFIVLFGLFEMLIGILFLIPKLQKIAIALLIPHLVTTVMPLLLLPTISWQTFMTPTLEGQYIIKNLLIASVALFLAEKHYKTGR